MLNVRMSAGYDPDAVRGNIIANTRTLPRGALIVCGNGPSLREADLPEGPKAALNGALPALLERGIVPDYAVAYDPSPENAAWYENAPHETVYLIASRCDAGVFEKLRGRNVIVWHVHDVPEMETLPAGTPMITGGSTVGLKALNLFATLGWKAFDIYGMDSCYLNGVHHASGQPWNDGDRPMPVNVGDRLFVAAPWMVSQAREAVDQFEANRFNYRVHVHGDGMVGALLDDATLTATYDLSRSPASYDFVTWLLTAEADRQLRGYRRLAVHFREGPDNGFRANEMAPVTVDQKTALLDSVCRPAIRMMGAMEADEGPEKQAHHYTLRTMVETYRKGGPLPEMRPDRDVQARVDRWLDGRTPYVITLREATYWPTRNSNVEAWTDFAKTLDGPVVFVRDTHRADEPLEGFEAFPDASRDLDARLALYRRAKMNFVVCNGPMVLAAYTKSVPYLCFNQLVPGFPAGTEKWWREAIGLEVGEQLPWAGERQSMTWCTDTFENITEHWKRME